ncbi:MAG: hypothetical protein EOO90_04535 [Pedobacter sp.]|nr:MAG: hypothetical protein EOO90_04535 [Pedobacter sp.]
MKKLIFLKVLVIMVMFTISASAKSNSVYSPYKNHYPEGSTMVSTNLLGTAWCGTGTIVLTITAYGDEYNGVTSYWYGVNGDVWNVFTENTFPSVTEYGVTISDGMVVEYVGGNGSGTIYPPAGFYTYQ